MIIIVAMMQNKYVNITSKIIHFSSKLQKTNKLKHSVFL